MLMAPKHTAPEHTLTDDFSSVCNWKEYILVEGFISSSLANELSLLSVLLRSYKSACLKEAYWWNFASALSIESLNHLDLLAREFPHPLQGLPKAWALCCSQLSCQHLLICGRLVPQPGRQWVLGLPEVFFFSSSVRDGELVSGLTISLMIDTFCGWSSLCLCDFKDEIVLAMISVIPSTSGLVSFLRTWKHSSSDIFWFSNSERGHPTL